MQNELHDGRELELLLSGKKPLAAFSYDEEMEESECFSGQDFENAVREGRLLRYDDQTKLGNVKVHHVLFALPNELWRAKAYMLLIRFMYERDWCAHLEWLQGTLLGYSDKQNSAHIREKYGRKDGRSCSG